MAGSSRRLSLPRLLADGEVEGSGAIELYNYGNHIHSYLCDLRPDSVQVRRQSVLIYCCAKALALSFTLACILYAF